jgi:DNA-binding transcriptional LysR family regulator
MVCEDLTRGDLVRVSEDWPTAAVGLFAVYPSNRLLPAKVGIFSDLIARHVRRQGLES